MKINENGLIRNMTKEEEKNADFKINIEQLKQELATYDYVGVKIATGVATIEEYSDKIEYCEGLRRKIRHLEGKE